MLNAPLTDLASYVVSVNASQARAVDRRNYPGIVVTNLRQCDSAVYGYRRMRICRNKRQVISQIMDIANQIAPPRVFSRSVFFTSFIQ